jgi:hypothetical protein
VQIPPENKPSKRSSLHSAEEIIIAIEAMISFV